MADDWAEDATRRAKASLINPEVPNAARVLNCLYGGQSNFEADRKAARVMGAAAPGVAALGPAGLSFRRRVLRYLLAEGIRQFIDIGAGLPLTGNTHEVVQSQAPECRVVYVDDDPMVISHARALLRSSSAGAVSYVDAPPTEPGEILAGARQILDFSQPVAVLFLFTLAYVMDTAEAAGAVAALSAAVPSGSFVAVCHLTSDLGPELSSAVRAWNTMLPKQPIVLRSGPDIAGLLTGLEPVPPGLVQVNDWHPDPEKRAKPVPLHGLVARKP